MLGKLARYLRLLGYDVEYPGPGPDSLLLARARREDRVLLTRDRLLCRTAERTGERPKVVEIRSDAVLEQLSQMANEGWLGEAGNPRCSLCNRPLEDLSPEEARHLLPPFTFAVHIRFLHCPGCNTVLWEGSHWERFRKRISGTFGGSR